MNARHQADRYHEQQAELAWREAPQPDLDEVMQRPEPIPAIPVEHRGPVQTQAVPARAGEPFAVLVTTTPEQILGADRTRSRAVLISTDNPFLISRTRSVNGTRTAALWPANVPCVLLHHDAVTVLTSSGTAALSVITEHWAQ